MNEERGGFSSRIGFVLATAGSAVGLGNIWRFHIWQLNTEAAASF